MKKILAGILGLALTVSLIGCSGNSNSPNSSAAEASNSNGGAAIKNQYNWTVAMNVAESTINYKGVAKFKEIIEEKSGGKIKLNLFANGQLGNDTEQMQSLQDGTVDFVTTITSGLTSFVPQYGVFDCPNVFPDLNTMRTVLDGDFKEALNKYSESQHIKLLGLSDAGFRQTTSSVKIESAKGFSGLKIRVIQNPYHIAYWKSIGANPTPMDFSEVYVSLTQKVIDAQENPYMNIVGNKFYEAQDYVIETNHLGHIIVFLMNSDLYNSLPQEVQTLVDESMREAVKYARGIADEQIAADKKTIVDSGTKIIELNPSEIQKMKEMSSGVYDQIRKAIGNELVDTLLSKVEAAKK